MVTDIFEPTVSYFYASCLMDDDLEERIVRQFVIHSFEEAEYNCCSSLSGIHLTVAFDINLKAFF